jgi:hypothetical protein
MREDDEVKKTKQTSTGGGAKDNPQRNNLQEFSDRMHLKEVPSE